MNKTSIGWTDFTSNPIRYRDADGKLVWACERASPACAHCYAAELAKRYGRGGGEFTKEELATYTPYFDAKEASKILEAKVVKGQQVQGSRVFIGDMTDIFGPWVPDALLDELFAVMALCDGKRSSGRRLDFQLLTKRPERARAYLTDPDTRFRIAAAVCVHTVGFRPHRDGCDWSAWKEWPLPNVWLGVSVENQHWADKRIPILLNTPAARRFISAEPLLKPINVSNYLRPTGVPGQCFDIDGEWYHEPGSCPDCWEGLDWGIGGGESGNTLRDPGVNAFVDLADQFTKYGRAFFMKQDVHRKPGQQGRIPDDIWALKQFPKAAA